MKKILLIGAAVVVGSTGFAQNNNRLVRVLPSQHGVTTEKNVFPVAVSKQMPGPIAQTKNNAKTTSSCNPTLFTKCTNGFAMGGGVTTDQQNMLSYNSDLNAVMWTSRHDPAWTFTSATSGAIQCNWLNVKTNTWDSMTLYRDSSTAVVGGRYPGGVILNTPGDTVLAHAYMVGTGPYVASAFAGVWYAARQPSPAGSGLNLGYHNAMGIATDANHSAYGTAPFGNINNLQAGDYGFLNEDMLRIGNKALVSGPLFDPKLAATANGYGVKGSVIGMATLSGGTVTWSSDSTSLSMPNNPNLFYLDPNLASGSGYANSGEGARIAFGPDGVTGYAVFIGRSATDYNNSSDSIYSPIVFKTTNGGGTWSQVLQGYDWAKCHPECMKNINRGRIPLANHAASLRDSTGNYKAYRFDFGNGAWNGSDLVVDVNGFLHYVTTVSDNYYTCGNHLPNGGNYRDSIGGNWVYDYDYVNFHPIIWDFITDGTAAHGWTTLMVDSILSGPCTSTSDSSNALSTWSDGSGGFLSLGAHLTVSRSTDGTKVIYGWAQSDFGTTGSHLNTAPDLFMKSLDLNTGKLSVTKNITGSSSETGTCFFPFLSDISYMSSAGVWVTPAVFTVGESVSGGVYNGAATVSSYYLNCASFNTTTGSDYPNPPVTPNICSAAVGIKTYSNNGFAGSVTNYPNPFNNTTNIVVNLNENNNIDLKVYDAIGNMVYSKNVKGTIGDNTIVFDASSVNSGVYFYTVTAGLERTTKKMVIQK